MSQKALMQNVNNYEYAVNNVITISQKSLSLHNYFTIQIMLFDSEALIIICLDTESTTIFIDKILVSSHSQQKKTQKVYSITACELADKQVLNCLIYLFMIISAQNPDNILTIIQITTAVYVVDSLKTEVLLRMNILTRKKTQLNLEHQTLFIKSKTAQILYSDIFYTFFHTSIKSLMYEILVTQKAYYTNECHMQVLNFTSVTVSIMSYDIVMLSALLTANAASSAFWAVSENLKLHQLTLHIIKSLQLSCFSFCHCCCKQFSSRNQLHHYLHSTHRNCC